MNAQFWDFLQGEQYDGYSEQIPLSHLSQLDCHCAAGFSVPFISWQIGGPPLYNIELMFHSADRLNLIYSSDLLSEAWIHK